MKTISLLFLFGLLGSFGKGPLPLEASSSHFSGDGTKESPYLLSSGEELLKLACLVNDEGISFRGCYFSQTNNIDLTGYEMIPIGTFDSPTHFEGIYDGAGHVLSNFQMHRDDNCGMFGMLGGTVMNLGIKSGEISGACVGVFSSHAASTDALVFNCYSSVNVIGGRAGGIVDNFNGSVINVYSSSTLSGQSVGGISSYSINHAVRCYSTYDPFPSGRSFGENCKKIDIGNASEAVDLLNEGVFVDVGHGIKSEDTYSWVLEKGEVSFGQKNNI